MTFPVIDYGQIDPESFDMKDFLSNIIQTVITSFNSKELALGWLRYECVRKMNARQFAELCELNLKGANFDELVDNAIIEWKSRYFGK